jgi:chromosome partitioning protein
MTEFNRADLSRVVAVINGKGGVLKTTLTANIGGMLANSGWHVLLVDLDPQGNLAEDLGYTGDDRDDQGKALAKALQFDDTIVPVKEIRPNLDVIVGGLVLDQATAGLSAKARADSQGAKLAVAALLGPIAGDYDIILIDCPPGDETLQTAAVAAARWALVPVKSDKSSRKGLSAVATRLDTVLDVNPTLDLLGVVLVDTGTNSTNVQREAREHIAQLFGGSAEITFSQTVRHSEATAQAARERGVLVYELDEHVRQAPKWYEVRAGRAKAESLTPQSASSVADDLQAVTRELVDRITVAEAAPHLQAVGA